MPEDLTDDKSTLAQVMAWCRQASRHYLNQCWPRAPMPYGITRPQWVNTLHDDNVIILMIFPYIDCISHNISTHLLCSVLFDNMINYQSNHGINLPIFFRIATVPVKQPWRIWVKCCCYIMTKKVNCVHSSLDILFHCMPHILAVASTSIDGFVCLFLSFYQQFTWYRHFTISKATTKMQLE